MLEKSSTLIECDSIVTLSHALETQSFALP